jgi:cytokinin dehydrogenase
LNSNVDVINSVKQSGKNMWLRDLIFMQGVEVMLRELRYARGLAFVKDVSYVQFLDRVSAGERRLRHDGLWDVAHPWLSLFLPRSRILDFAAGVFHGVLRRRAVKGGGGPVLVYPMNRGKWDGATSAVLPTVGDGQEEEEVFYTVSILRSAVADGDLRRMEEQNAEVARFCEAAGIPCTQYLPYYAGPAGGTGSSAARGNTTPWRSCRAGRGFFPTHYVTCLMGRLIQ